MSLAAESESIDSEKWLFDHRLQEYKAQIPNLILRKQFNDRRKKTAGLCEEIRKRLAMMMDGGEDFFVVDSKPIEVCRLARMTLYPFPHITGVMPHFFISSSLPIYLASAYNVSP